MNLYKSFFLAAISLITCALASAQEPAGYYTPCEGSSGAALLTKLKNKISSHTNVGYDGLWAVYNESDIDQNGKIWDMYSTKRWTPGKEHCGNYKLVGDCINREHSVPQSWFNDANPMKSDAFHVYPTDGKVNGQRSNYPYGECANGTTLPSNNGVQALGKLGTSTFPGYTGKVFEPVDEYKGDFARSYFYMAACYNDKIAGWNSDMLAGNAYPAFKAWAVDLLLKWHRQDPVSQKEIDRNNAIYRHQHNRNPFIDHPELAEHIWGTKTSTPWYANSTADPEIILPADGSTLDFGTIATTGRASLSVTVKGAGLTSPVVASVSTTAVALSRTSIPVSEACSVSGGALTLSWAPTAEGTLSAILTLKSGTETTRVNLTGKAVSGLPALPATNITPEGFTARWIYVGDADARDCYTLHVLQGQTEVAGYPRDVTAAAEQYTVAGLKPRTTYTYYLVSAGQTSDPVSVTTTELVPSISTSIDVTTFLASPESPSTSALIELDIENIDGDLEATVKAPFELSTDGSNWSQFVAFPPTATALYVRLGAAPVGDYETTVTISGDDIFNDEITLHGIVSAPSQGGLTIFVADGYEIEDADPDASVVTLYNKNHDTSGTNTVAHSDQTIAAEGFSHASDHVTLTFDKGTNSSNCPTVWYSANKPAGHVRMYKSNTFTLTPSATSKITKVEVGFTSNAGTFNVSDGSTVAPNNLVCTYSNDHSGPLTFTAAAALRPSYIAVTTENATNIIDAVVEPESQAVYYDLRGIRVSEPRTGEVYVKVTARGAQKIVY